ncbi:MAG: glutaredoxin family protein [Nitrososphaeria archaeon]
METMKVQGLNRKHKVLIYTISMCAWCKKTKKFLSDIDSEYEYVDIDLCSKEDQDQIRNDIKKRGGSLVYPTMIIDDKIMVQGFLEDEIREALAP